MGNQLSSLLDFQKYEKNAKLQAVIDSVHARYSAARLSDDDVDLVCNALRNVIKEVVGTEAEQYGEERQGA